MTWAFQNTGTLASATPGGSFSLPYPTGISAGDILFAATHWGPISGTISIADTGFQAIVSRTNNATSYLWWKIASGTETGSTTVTKGGSSGQGLGQMARFTGGPTTLTGNIHVTNSTGSSATTGLFYPALTITQDNCLVMATGCKPADCFGFNVPADFDAEINEFHTGTGMCFVWDYKIQTVATNVPTGSWTISTDVSASRNTIAAALIGAAPAPTAPSLIPSRLIFILP